MNMLISNQGLYIFNLKKYLQLIWTAWTLIMIK